jgi:ketosteroid isomerase-like protein
MAGQQNVDTAKQAYEAFSAGDAEAAMARIADDVEWITPGNSAISGTVHGKQDGASWAQLAEKGFTTSPPHWFSDEDRVVALTQVTVGGEPADQADVLTHRDWSSSRRRETPPYRRPQRNTRLPHVSGDAESHVRPSLRVMAGEARLGVVLGGVAVGAPRHASCVLVNTPIAHEQGERHR